MTPKQLASSGTESAEQKALFCWCALNKHIHPELAWIFSIPNGGRRDLITGARLKAEGLKKGVPDLFLPTPRLPHCGLFLEMKRKSVGRVQDNQNEWIAYLNKAGYLATVCYGWEEARTVILTYLRY